jgi:acyl-coenzyme A thioesterase PaaI-like protein
MNRGSLYKTVFTNPLGIRALLWSRLPLAAFAGLRVARLDESGSEVRLPAGWKTQNPFGSTYFAAQAMAAEMSTGAPALWFIEQSGEKVSSLVTAISAKFTRKATTEARFVFDGGAKMREAIAEAVRTGEPVVFTARSVGTQRDGSQIAEFNVEWSFKKKGSK